MKYILRFGRVGHGQKYGHKSVFMPIQTTGDLLQCGNYMTIALVSYTSKVLLRVILDRMCPKLERKIGQEPAGFRPNRGTCDQITNLRIILEKSK